MFSKINNILYFITELLIILNEVSSTYGNLNNKNISELNLLRNKYKQNNVVYKIYYTGRLYRSKEDPEGKECPIPWKYVNNKEESDIIGFYFENRKIINKIENYKYNKTSQKLLLFNKESPVRFPFLEKKKKYFDYIIDFRLDSDVPIPYIKKDYNFAKSPFPTKEKKKDNRGLAAVFISNCHDKIKRLQLVKQLMNYIKIDSYGKCMHNKDPISDDIGKSNSETKMNIIRKYKFTLAFENSFYRDYVTEKFFEPLVEGSVPVYYGAPNIDEFSPDEHSYIDVSKFQNAKELAEYLKFLDKNDTEYEKYLNWKKKAKNGDLGENLNRIVNISKLNSVCKLLQRINNMWINPFLTVWDRKDVQKNERTCILC